MKKQKIKNIRTDWTSYYAGKRSVVSTLTQKCTLEIIIKYLELSYKGDKIDILELGGGNSCFASQICKNKPIGSYDIIDNNELSIDLFKKQSLMADHHNGYNIDLMLPWESQNNRKYDFVYSIGLIEHFDRESQRKVVLQHFNYCKEGGIVLISFPTPTKKYLFIRKLMELLGLWQFWDEVPLKVCDIDEVLEEQGYIKSIELNKKLPLSQMVVVVEKKHQDVHRMD